MSQTPTDLRLKPRVLMLIHSSKVLLQAIDKQPRSSFLEQQSVAAVHWDWEGASFAKKNEVISELVLSLPAPTLLCAQIRVEASAEVLPETVYQCPSTTWQLLDPQNTVQETLVIPGGRVKTPATGRLSQYLQEYWASLLEFDLSIWKFSCRRQKQLLEISAGSECSGWNLQLQELTYDYEDALPWSGGLFQGLSSLDPEQQAGQIGFLWWGPYLINSQRCEICLPYSENLPAFASAFIEELNISLGAANIKAHWTADRKLLLQHQDRGQSLEILRSESPPALSSPHQYLNLDLPLGKHELLLEQKQESLCLNQVEIHLPPPPEDLTELSNWLMNAINSQQEATGVMISLGADNHFVLHSLKPFEPVSLTGLSSWLKKCTGLSESRPPGPDPLQNSFEQWMRLLNALGPESSWQENLPLDKCLSEQRHLLNWNAPDWEWQPQLLKQADALRRFVNAILVYAQAFVELPKAKTLDSIISKSAQGPAVLENSRETTTSTSPASAKPLEPEKPKASFDHKI